MPSNTKWKKQQFRQVILVGILLLLLAGGVYGYAKYRETSSLLPVSFVIDGKETPRFFMEIANTPSERKKGLMFRKHLAENRGMIFIFPEEKQRGFWMKNTYISLDMIFVSEGMEVIGVVPNTPTLSEDRQSVIGKSKYVLEFIAGTAKRFGVTKGVTFKLDGDLPKPL